MLLTLLMPFAQDATVTVDRDNVKITKSCKVVIAKPFIEDADGNGVIQIEGDNLVVDFAGAKLHGAPPDREPDAFKGTGVTITGKGVTLKGAQVSGFKCGVLAVKCDGLTVVECDVSGNWQQRLKSTPAAEDGSDWLWPHRNDKREWVTNYGAGICIEDSAKVTVRDCRARDGQNGLVLDRVRESAVYDNDFSFLSGWGVAMWRCRGNMISRNAIDFCVRGYSHGVYNRGQDSAGILLFEQNHDNVFAENSVTHGGDGIFAFAGREALGEDWWEEERERVRKETKKDDVEALIKVPAERVEKHRGLGNSGNVFIGNDLSYAPAHGLELTFSFDNKIINNRFVENAICGIWGGYSQTTYISGNKFEGNGEGAYGMERGGINIEHGVNNVIVKNTFARNKCGVHLWWDADPGLMRMPWGLANDPLSKDNIIVDNEFKGDDLAIQLRETRGTVMAGNKFADVKKQLDSVDSNALDALKKPLEAPALPDPSKFLGKRRPVGARKELAGRDKIIITQWGPYDWQAPYLQSLGVSKGEASYRVLGKSPVASADAAGDVTVKVESREGEPPTVTVKPKKASGVFPYTLTVKAGEQALTAKDVLIAATWKVKAFANQVDPRKDFDGWRKEAEKAVEFETDAIDLRFGGGGPSEIRGIPKNVADAKLPREHFGIIAETSLEMPAGKWRLTTESDDGVRVFVDDEAKIDNWTWHVPTRDTGEITIDKPRTVKLRVEYFELDGFATLTFKLEKAD